MSGTRLTTELSAEAPKDEGAPVSNKTGISVFPYQSQISPQRQVF